MDVVGQRKEAEEEWLSEERGGSGRGEGREESGRGKCEAEGGVSTRPARVLPRSPARSFALHLLACKREVHLVVGATSDASWHAVLGHIVQVDPQLESLATSVMVPLRRSVDLVIHCRHAHRAPRGSGSAHSPQESALQERARRHHTTRRSATWRGFESWTEHTARVEVQDHVAVVPHRSA